MKPLTFQLSSTITLGANIWMIAITGGPCSGKTTGLAKLVQMLKDKGYKVLVSSESATKLIDGGVYPWELQSAVFQRQILLDTLMQEERFIEAAMTYRDMGHKVVILCDRGTMDGIAYVGEEKFGQLCASLGLSFHDICNQRYHAVMHLRTAALGAESFYTLENNSARKETPQEARELDQRTLEAWQRHHHPRVIDNAAGFDEKIQSLLAEVSGVLGDPIPIEREVKFLIEPLNLEDLQVIHVHVSASQIVQDYLLPTSNGVAEGIESGERRVRARSDDHGTSYFYTVKKHIRSGERLEVERMISQREYEELLALKDPTLQTIKKRRLCFFWENQFIEVDLFENPKGLVLMEIEQSELQRDLILPPFIEVVNDVTDDKRYSNRELARGSFSGS